MVRLGAAGRKPVSMTVCASTQDCWTLSPSPLTDRDRRLPEATPDDETAARQNAFAAVHGFPVLLVDPRGQAEALRQRVHVFGTPATSTWRPNPLRWPTPSPEGRVPAGARPFRCR